MQTLEAWAKSLWTLLQTNVAAPVLWARNTEGGSITVPLTSSLTGLELAA